MEWPGSPQSNDSHTNSLSRSNSSLVELDLPFTDRQLISKWGSYFAEKWSHSKIEVSLPSHQPNDFQGKIETKDQQNKISFSASESVFRGTVLAGLFVYLFIIMLVYFIIIVCLFCYDRLFISLFIYFLCYLFALFIYFFFFFFFFLF
jgi:hypothetical protein